MQDEIHWIHRGHRRQRSLFRFAMSVSRNAAGLNPTYFFSELAQSVVIGQDHSAKSIKCSTDLSVRYEF